MDTGYVGNASSSADAFPGQARVAKLDDTSTGEAHGHKSAENTRQYWFYMTFCYSRT